MFPLLRALVWAQWRSLLHSRSRPAQVTSRLASAMLLLWIAAWGFIAVSAGRFVARPSSLAELAEASALLLLFFSFLWQLLPPMLSPRGLSLQLKRLRIYPISTATLLAAELASGPLASFELTLLLAGAALGLACNPALPLKTAPIALGLLLAFNVALACILRLKLEAFMSRRRFSELLLLFLALAAALPQLVIAFVPQHHLELIAAHLDHPVWPWSAAAGLSLGIAPARSLFVLLAWTCVFLGLAGWQLARAFRSDFAPPPARLAQQGLTGAGLASPLTALLPDPLAALVEKEIRCLLRTPRFRLVFVMGFTFAVLLFLPLMLAERQAGSAFWEHHRLTVVVAYALLLLGDALFWNIFGLDRSATASYYLAAYPPAWVFLAKNLAALLMIALEILAVATVWVLLRLPLGAGSIAEAMAVTFTLALYFMAAGNLLSVSYPRPVGAFSAGVGSAPTVRFLLLALYPVLASPVLLAYAVLYRFRSRAAFYALLVLALLNGAVLYKAALDAAVRRAVTRREELLAGLSETGAPFGST